MSNFQKINRVFVPKRFVESVYKHLREAGEVGVEGVALWLGRQEENVFNILCSLIPAQNAYRTPEGLLYKVDAEELHRINKWAYKEQIVLVAQVHSHPGEAYHSGTDDAYPIVTTLGGLSIVIPDFGFGPMDITTWKVYRLEQEGWIEILEREVQQLFEIR